MPDASAPSAAGAPDRAADPFDGGHSGPAPYRLVEARVTALIGAGDAPQFLVDDGDGRRLAARAAGCLLEPAEGDTVLLGRSGPDRAFILTVLLRGPDAAATVSVEGADSVTLRAPALSLRGDESCSVATACLDVEAGETELRSGRARLIGDAVSAVVGTLETVGRELHAVADFIHRSAGTYLRVSRETDTVHGGTLLRRADGPTVMESEQTVLSARSDVRISGERISMG